MSRAIYFTLKQQVDNCMFIVVTGTGDSVVCDMGYCDGDETQFFSPRRATCLPWKIGYTLHAAGALVNFDFYDEISEFVSHCRQWVDAFIACF